MCLYRNEMKCVRRALVFGAGSAITPRYAFAE